MTPKKYLIACLLVLLFSSSTLSACSVGQEEVDANGVSICRNCTVETYNINGDGRCRECPPVGAKCFGGSRITSENNYWLYLDTTGSVRPYSCPDNFCEAGSQCSKFRTGLLCGRCLPGYNQFYLTGGPCVKCNSVDWSFLFLIIIGLWALVTFLTVAEMMENTAKVKVIIFFVQTVPLILGPQFRTSSILNLFNISAGSSSDTFACLAPLDFYGQFVLNVILPFAIIVFLPINYFISMGVSELACRYWPPEAIDEENPEKASLPEKLRQFCSTPPRKSLYVRTFCAVLLFDYSSIANAVFMFRTCQGVAGMRVLASAPGVSCQTNTYSRWLILATILQVYVALAPVVLLGFLLYLNLTSQMFRTFWLTNVGVFYDAYKMRAFWWECVVLLRRSLVSFLYLTFFNNPGMRTYTLLVACVTMLVIHLLALPYRQKIENYGEAYLLFILVMIASVQSSDATRVTTSLNGLLIGVIASSAIGIIMVASWDWQLKGLQFLEKRQSNLLFTRLVRFLERYTEEKKRNQPRSLSVFYKWRAQALDEDLQTEMRLYTGGGAPIPAGYPMPAATPNADIRVPLTASASAEADIVDLTASLPTISNMAAAGGSYQPPTIPSAATASSGALTSSMEEARRKKMPKPAARPPSVLYKKLSDANASSLEERTRLTDSDENRNSHLEAERLGQTQHEETPSSVAAANLLTPSPLPPGYGGMRAPYHQPESIHPIVVEAPSANTEPIERPLSPPSPNRFSPSPEMSNVSRSPLPVRKPTPPRLAPVVAISPQGSALPPSALVRASRLKFHEPPIETRQSTRRVQGILKTRTRAATGHKTADGASATPSPRAKRTDLGLDLRMVAGSDIGSTRAGKSEDPLSPRSKQKEGAAPPSPSRAEQQQYLAPVPGSGAPLPARSPLKSVLRPSRAGEPPPASPEDEGGLFSMLREKLSHIPGLSRDSDADGSGSQTPTASRIPITRNESPRPYGLATPKPPSSIGGSVLPRWEMGDDKSNPGSTMAMQLRTPAPPPESPPRSADDNEERNQFQMDAQQQQQQQEGGEGGDTGDDSTSRRSNL